LFRKQLERDERSGIDTSAFRYKRKVNYMEVKITSQGFCRCPKESLMAGIEKIEIIDEVNRHRFIFTQKEDNGVFLEILPYDGKLG